AATTPAGWASAEAAASPAFRYAAAPSGRGTLALLRAREDAMKAAVMRAWKAPLTIEDVDVDAPGPREVLVRTVATGVCHSDLHVLEGSLPVPPPTVLGHEPAGVVEAAW